MGSDPRRVAEVILAAAIRTRADAVLLDPGDDDSYTVTFERDETAFTTVELDPVVGAATVARLAYIAKLDLASTVSSSAVAKIQSGDREADVVITVRPGEQLRAELLILQRHRRAPGPISLKPGDVVGNYRIIEPLGRGGMGKVFRVEHTILGRPYALKILRARVFERDPTAAQKFLREARAAARVRHPNIGDVFDFGRLADGRPYFVMELLAGESLADLVDRGPLAPAQVVTIARQLASALVAVHDQGVVHADITPSNVIVLPGDPLHVKLIDFGLAAISGETFDDEDPTFVMGTPAYVSPERLRGLPPSDRSDQYGLGVVLFELLTGRPPYVHADLRELCMLHVKAPIPLVLSPRGALPPRLDEVIHTCLAKSPQDRFPGMRAMLAALDEIERGTTRIGWRKWVGA